MKAAERNLSAQAAYGAGPHGTDETPTPSVAAMPVSQPQTDGADRVGRFHETMSYPSTPRRCQPICPRIPPGPCAIDESAHPGADPPCGEIRQLQQVRSNTEALDRIAHLAQKDDDPQLRVGISALVKGVSLHVQEVVPSSVELRRRSGEHQAALTWSLCPMVPADSATSRSSAARSAGRCR